MRALDCSSGWATNRRASREPRYGRPPGGGSSTAPATASPEQPQAWAASRKRATLGVSSRRALLARDHSSCASCTTWSKTSCSTLP
eukprot:12773967-Alexandrium_andersonii.AAC.1